MIKYPKPNFQNAISHEHEGYVIEIFPLNETYEWEVTLEGELIDNGPGRNIEECKEIVSGVIEAYSTREELCGKCNGSGEGYADGTKCQRCKGSGVE